MAVWHAHRRKQRIDDSHLGAQPGHSFWPPCDPFSVTEQRCSRRGQSHKPRSVTLCGSALEWGYTGVGNQLEAGQVQNRPGVEMICGRNRQELVGIKSGAKQEHCQGLSGRVRKLDSPSRTRANRRTEQLPRRNPTPREQLTSNI